MTGRSRTFPRSAARGPRRALGAWLALALAVLALAGVADAAIAPRESDVKAAFLFNFASFIDWPGQAYASPEAPFVIGIIGDDPFGSILDEIVAGETIKGHPLAIRRLTSRQVAEAAACHILFVSQSEARRLRPILQAVRGKPVLTVSDAPGFIEAGGALAFTTDTSVKLSINPLAARTASLTVSSKLLRLAQVVEKEVAP